MEFGYVEACALWMQQLILHFWLTDIHDFSLNWSGTQCRIIFGYLQYALFHTLKKWSITEENPFWLAFLNPLFNSTSKNLKKPRVLGTRFHHLFLPSDADWQRESATPERRWANWSVPVCGDSETAFLHQPEMKYEPLESQHAEMGLNQLWQYFTQNVQFPAYYSADRWRLKFLGSHHAISKNGQSLKFYFSSRKTSQFFGYIKSKLQMPTKSYEFHKTCLIFSVSKKGLEILPNTCKWGADFNQKLLGIKLLFRRHLIQ